MVCRVGITTDLAARKSYWKRKFPRTFRNWQVVATFHSKSHAQAYENILANSWGCQSAPGGGRVERPVWYVYYFEHGPC